jgi:Fic family protein
VDIVENKYNLTAEQNIFVAKRNIVDYIWKSANLEGIIITYSDTQTIYDGFSVSGYKLEEINAINNLKKAWQFILNDIGIALNFVYICKINELVGENIFYNPGIIRTTPVNIGGTSWKPDFPIETKIKEELEELLSNNEISKTEQAINIMLWVMRRQMFIDGNKRTAMLIANKLMIENGCGIISIPIEKQSEFYKLLITYYETNDSSIISKFIYDNAIDGMIF